MLWRRGLITGISIHAPREGGDNGWLASNQHIRISIHAPREGGDGARWLRIASKRLFQSTPPARGATPSQRAIM